MKVIYKTKDNKEFDNERDAVWHEKELVKDESINTTQQLVFELLKRASFNGFDGEHTVSYLVKNKDKWNGVMPKIDYYALRDIGHDMFHIDTIEVSCRSEETAETFSVLLKRNLHPQECFVDKNIITLWWD